MSFAVEADRGDYLRTLEERAQKLLELASEMSSSSQTESAGFAGRNRQFSRIQPNRRRVEQEDSYSHTVSRRRGESGTATYPSLEDSNQKTFPEREAGYRMRSQDQRIEQLEEALAESRSENRRLSEQVRMLQARLQSRGTGDGRTNLEEQLERFKQTERQRLRQNLEQQIEHWSAKIKQTTKRHSIQIKDLMEQLQKKETQHRRSLTAWQREKRQRKKLLRFVKEELPRLNQQMARSVELVEREIVSRTNPHLHE